MLYSICYYCISHKGNIRNINQDTYFCIDQIMKVDIDGSSPLLKGKSYAENTSVFGVFDGMGGEECGEIAARIAAEGLKNRVFSHKPKEQLLQYFKQTNAEICNYTEAHGLSSMGTTAAMLAFTSKYVYVCNIGDSKVFCLSGETLRQLSCDHVYIGPYGTKPPLSQNLGIPENELLITPYIVTQKLNDGDVYIICSDGLTDMLSSEEILNILLTSDRNIAAEQLLKMSLARGGRDNITIQLIYITEERISISKKIINLMRYGNGHDNN